MLEDGKPVWAHDWYAVACSILHGRTPPDVGFLPYMRLNTAACNESFKP